MTKPTTQMFTRKPFQVEAVQVTTENFDEVRQWCNGKFSLSPMPEDSYFKVQVRRPLNERQTRAYIGDWVLFAGKGFKVYSDKAFRESYEVVSNVETLYQKALQDMKAHKAETFPGEPEEMQEELPFNVVDHTDQVGKLRPRIGPGDIKPKPAPVRPLSVVRTAKATGIPVGFSPRTMAAIRFREEQARTDAMMDALGYNED